MPAATPIGKTNSAASTTVRHVVIAPLLSNMAESHRMASVAGAFAALGQDVTILGEGRYAHLFDPLPVRRATVPCDAVWSEPEVYRQVHAADQYGLDWLPVDRLVPMVRDDVEALRRLRPDVVVTGFRPTMSVATKVTGTPLVWCISAVVSDLFFESRLATPLQTPMVAAWFARFLPLSWRKAILCRLGWRLPVRIRNWNRAMAQIGLPRFPSLVSVFRGDFNLISDAPELFPELSAAPPYYAFCGPLLPEFDVPAPASLASYRRTPGRRAVFFSMGSSGDPALFRSCLDALATATDLDVFVATLSVADPASLGPLPPHMIVERLFPMPQVLAHCDVAVVHGGSGTVNSVMWAGVPFVGVPMFSEQQYNLETLARRGCGVVLDRTRLTAASLLRTLRDVLQTPSYGERARSLRTAIAPYRSDPERDPKTVAARLVLDFLDHPERSYFLNCPYVRCFRALRARQIEAARAQGPR
jgi:UDP:flavonoid glycosyltransferase YjiC (YdhE family)